MTKAKHVFLLLCIAILSSCNPDDDDNNGNNNNPSDFIENFGSDVQRDFMGQIVDSNDNPIQNATVKIGSSTVQTDVNGIFRINDAEVYQQFAYVTATKAGFIDGSRSLIPNTGMNNVKIMLIPNSTTTTISSGQAAEVSISSGTKVIFDGAFADENGIDYSGEVAVSVFHLTASDENLDVLMPGMLYAENESGEEALLQTFGMLHVELRGSGGQKLQIADGHTAEITMLIDNTQLATAPTTIPLWHFDEAVGYWKEDGVATKQGNFYVGEVTHFSWWNCDAQFPTVTLTTTVIDVNGNPLANITVGLLTSLDPYERRGYSNADGQISGLIPANEALTMNVYDNCDNLISTSQIGPFSSDTMLPAITLSGGTSTTTIQGTLLSCDNSIVTNGYVMLAYGGQGLFTSVTNGDFSFTTVVCATDTSFTLKGADLDTMQVSDSINFTYTIPVTNVGNIITCTSVDEFLIYQIDSNPEVVLIADAGAYASSGQGPDDGLIVYGSNNNQSSSLYIFLDAMSTGTFTEADDFYFEGTLGYITPANSDNMTFIVSNFGAVGEYIDMTFSGSYIDDLGVNHTITGSAHVIRNN